MEDRYKSFSSSELAGEDSFIQWVMLGENHQQWTQWQQTYPERASVVEEAKEIVKALREHSSLSMDEQSKTELWNRIKSNISTHGQKSKAQKQYRLLKWGLAAAATFALLVWFSSEKAVRNVVVHSGEKEEISLPDKLSKVTVNAGSKLSYNNRGFKVEREVRLEGEAFFNVNPGTEFTVITPLGTVTVLGTSFNVIAWPGRFEVSCYTGKVRVQQGLNDKVVITPGERVYTEKLKEKLNIKPFDATSLSPEWIQGKFTFDDQPLSVVFNELERQYDVRVKLSPGIEDIRYTGPFESGNLDTAVYIITWPLHLKYQISGKTISISR
jgi:ferric-dicitrate binding protein FerR (iron transport regulator)